MICAIMQPYLFPYLGYYQLVAASDKFVFFDDVNFKKRSYINRNNILLNGNSHLFTLPVLKASQNRKINEHQFSTEQDKMLKTLEYAYRKAPFYDDVMPVILGVLNFEDRNVATITSLSVTRALGYLGIEKGFLRSSEIDAGKGLAGGERILQITKALGCDEYRNPIGGQSLYSKESFANHGIILKFLKMSEIHYPQETASFVPNLSMIDVLMWNSKSKVLSLLKQFTLI